MLQRVQQEVRSLLVDDQQPGSTLPPGWHRVLRFWVMVVQSFVRNRCPVRATALAYSSLLAFVPMLAVVIAVSTSILKNDADRIQDWIKGSIFQVAPQLQNSTEFGVTVDSVVRKITDMIANVQSGAIGTTGVLALLVMILFMLARIEETMNDIWGASRGRSWFSRLVNYWAAISLGPIVLFSAAGLTATVNVPRLEVTLAPGDLKDLSALHRRLNSTNDSVAVYVAAKLSAEARAELARPFNPQTPAPGLLRELVTGLNSLIEGPPLHAPGAFTNVALREESRRLVDRPPEEGPELRRLNRLLLEDAFPKELARRPAWLTRYLGGSVGTALVGLLQIPLLTLACAAFYAFMPNTKVHWRAAVFGGFVAALLWYLNNTVSTRFVSRLTRDGAIYGSLAAVPVLMVGLYFFWMLLLFGAQVAYNFQNRRSFLAARESDRVNQDGRELVALRLMLECAGCFSRGAAPPTVPQLSERLEVPSHLVHQIIRVLSATGLLVETAHPEPGFVPGRPLDQIKVADVLGSMRRGLGSRLPTRADPARLVAERELQRVLGAENQAGSEALARLV